MIQLILFDLGGVLFTNGLKIFSAAISQRYGLPVDKVKDILDGAWGSLYREGKISRDVFWQGTVERLHLTEPIDALEHEWFESYAIIPGTREIVNELFKRYTIFYLSDNMKEREEYLNKKFQFTLLFHGGVFSHEVGARKPDPRIYQHALEKAQISGEETLFIDDKPTALVPAQSMGMTTILFESPEQLREALRGLQILS